jgi:universal stress protein A
VAAENECDLIVLGHGRTGLDHILMGSVSQQVVVHAKCPVLVAKAV